MADYYKFIVGLAAAASTKDSPILDEDDYYEFFINPETWDGSYQGGVLSTTISGAPRVSTTQLPTDAITIRWPYLTATVKRTKCDYYFLLNKKLILIDDQRYMMEVVVNPGSYVYSRRRSIKGEPESYQVQVQLIVCGIKSQISVPAREAL